MSASTQLAPTAMEASPGALAPLLQGAGVVTLDDVGWLRVTGPDRVRWLNGMVTHSIQELQPGQGCYSFLLNAQGRIEGDCTAFALSDALLLETAADRLAGMTALLDRFIIMDDVELEPLPPANGLLLAGPRAPALLDALGLTSDPAAVPIARGSATFKGEPITLIHAYSPLVPRFELWAAPETLNRIRAALLGAGAGESTPEALELLRILEGTPRFGTDIRDKDMAQETALAGTPSRALHFSKGCYLGQEIVERIRSRGQVHRTLSGFLLNGELPEPGSVLAGDARQPLTSFAAIPLASGTVQLALGYIRREALERGEPLPYPGGAATSVALPFRGALVDPASPNPHPIAESSATGAPPRP